MLTVTIGRGKSGHVTVDYRIAVSDKARILDYTGPGLARSTTGNEKELLFRADAKSAQNLEVGDILLAAEGPKTPLGLLRRVVSLERRGDLLAVQTASARLNEAMPKAVLRFTRTPPKASTPESEMRPAAYRAEDPSPTPEEKPGEGEFAIKMNTWQQKLKHGEVACGTGVPLVKLETTWPNVDLSGSEIGFNLRDAVWADIQAKVEYSAKVTLGTPHGAQCSYEYESPDLFKLPARLVKLVRVGPFSVRPAVTGIGGLEAKAEGGMKIESGGKQDWKFTSRLSLLPHASGTLDGPKPFTTSISGVSEGKLKGKLGLRIKLEASDLIEVFITDFYLDAALALEGSVDPLAGQGKVEGFAEAGVGIEFKPGEFKTREIGATFASPKYTFWESDKLMPPLAFATDHAIKVKSGMGSPDTVATLPAGMAVRQITWSPDGKRLAWSTAPTRSGHNTGRIYLADLATGDVGNWECWSCRISFGGDRLLSMWDKTLGGEEAGFAWYRIGQNEPSTVQLENPATLHHGQTQDEVWEVARKYCGTGGCATIDLYGEAARSGDSLIGIPWNDCRPKLFRVNSRLQASALTVANTYPDVIEPGPDGRLLLSGVNSGGCDELGKPSHLEFSEVSKTGQLSTVPAPAHYHSWEPCYLWYDEKKNPHAVLAPPMDDGDVLTQEYPCFQQMPRKFRTLKKQGKSWEESGDAALLRRTQGDWSAELHVGGRLTAKNSSQRFRVSERVRTFAWSSGAS